MSQGYKALHSPYTGIVNWTQVAHSYAEDIQNAGGTICTKFEVCVLCCCFMHGHKNNFQAFRIVDVLIKT